MSRRWASNGSHWSPNEVDLTGQRVILVQKRTVIVGTLGHVKANTGGNVTLAVSWGPGRWRSQPIWMLREKPFTINPAPAHMADGKYHHSILDHMEVHS